MVKSKPENLILYLSVIFANEDLREKMVLKIPLMVNTKALRDTRALTVKHASNGGRRVIDI